MKRKRYTVEQITSILKEHEARASVPDLFRPRELAAQQSTYLGDHALGRLEFALLRVSESCCDQCGSGEEAFQIHGKSLGLYSGCQRIMP